MASVLRQRTGWTRDGRRAGGRPVALTVDGTTIEGTEGECLAVTLALAGYTVLRHSPVEGSPRGVFCLMGSCQECVLHVDGVPVLACMEPVRPAMRVELDRFARRHTAPAASD